MNLEGINGFLVRLLSFFFLFFPLFPLSTPGGPVGMGMGQHVGWPLVACIAAGVCSPRDLREISPALPIVPTKKPTNPPQIHTNSTLQIPIFCFKDGRTPVICKDKGILTETYRDGLSVSLELRAVRMSVSIVLCVCLDFPHTFHFVREPVEGVWLKW